MRPIHSLRSRDPYYHVSTRKSRPQLAPLTARRRQLVARNLNLAYHVLNKHFPLSRHNADIWSELTYSAVYGLILAASRYTRSRGAFSTYAYSTVWGTISKAITTYQRRQALEQRAETYPSTFIPDWSDPDPLTLALASESTAIIQNALRYLDPTDALIVQHHFGLNNYPILPLAELATKLSVTTERIKQRYRRAIKRLREYIPIGVI